MNAIVQQLRACVTRAREFRQVPGFDGRYQVTDDGLVRARAHHWTTGNHGNIVRLAPAGWVRQHATRHGYRVVHLRGEGARVTTLVHRLVAAAFIANPDGLPHVNHRNLRRWDNGARNLEWCTALHNKRHSASARRRYGRFAHLPVGLPAANDL